MTGHGKDRRADGGLPLRRRPPGLHVEGSSRPVPRRAAGRWLYRLRHLASRVVPPARSRSPTAWRMRGGSSSTCTNDGGQQSPRKRCAGSARFMPSRRGIRGRSAEERVAVRQAETKPLMATLWAWLMERLGEISAKSRWPKRSATRSATGKGSHVFLADGRSRSTTTRWNAASGPIPLGRRNALFAGDRQWRRAVGDPGVAD